MAAGSLAQTNPVASRKTLIVPGRSIGSITLGSDAGSVEQERGKPDLEDAAMGGKQMANWYLGTRRGDKGRIFNRPDMLGISALRDMGRDTAAKPSKAAITQIRVTSPRYSTAEGIAPGSTLDAIRAKFPDIQPDAPNDTALWPLYGEVQFYKDVKHGIAFAVRNREGTCIEVDVMSPDRAGYFAWAYPLATQDYTIDDIDGRVGDIRLGMTATKLTVLLGPPDEKHDAGSASGGSLWRWRIPSQRRMELPALGIYLRKLPDGTLVCDQIRVTSPAFALTDRIFPGCPLKEILQATANITKIDSYPDEHLDIYGDLRAGILFDVRQSDSTCTAITIIPASLQVHAGMAGRWLDLPQVPAGDD